jgi:sterol desaturase/sphingolipid hydroxylase (fatty acid hydroxylase superfamily)
MIHLDWPFYALLAILVLTALTASGRKAFAAGNGESWALELVGLFMHQIGFRIISGLFVFKLFSLCVPGWRHGVEVGWLQAAGLTLVVHYLAYWDHRLLHSETPLWNVHQVHHSAAKEMNPLSSFRQTIWAPMFEPFFWAIPFVIYIAKDPSRYMAIESVILVHVFWAHSGLNLPRDSWLRRVLSLVIIQPEDHAWHHSTERANCNFASFFCIWDKLHGTWYKPGRLPESLGVRVELPLWKKLLFPWPA